MALANLKEFAATLRIARRTARTWCERGDVPALQVNGRWRVDIARLEHLRPDLHAAYAAGLVSVPIGDAPAGPGADFDGRCGEG